MSDQNPTHAVVRRTLLRGMRSSQAITTMATVCGRSAQCPQIQASALGMQALGAMQACVTTAAGSNTAHSDARAAVRKTGKALTADVRAAKKALSTFEGIVDGIAAGDATVISATGLLSRDDNPPAPPLDKVSKLDTEPGKKLATAKLKWPAAAGAACYALELNPTPQNPTGPWTSAGLATPRRTRIVTAPSPGAQMLARVAAVAGDGTQSEWSDVVLVTTR